MQEMKLPDLNLDPSKIMIRRTDTITSRPWMDNGRRGPASTSSDVQRAVTNMSRKCEKTVKSISLVKT